MVVYFVNSIIFVRFSAYAKKNFLFNMKEFAETKYFYCFVKRRDFTYNLKFMRLKKSK